MDTTQEIAVLIIEDNPTTVQLIRTMLGELESSRGGRIRFDLATADRLREGLDRFERNEVHVVLLDLSLPDAQGLAVYKQLRQTAPTVPVIVLAHIDDEKQAAEAVRAGAADYLVKGRLDSEVLFRSLHYAMERQRLLSGGTADNRLKDFLTNWTEPFLVADKDGLVLFANAAALRLLGQRADELVGYPLGVKLSGGAAVEADIHGPSGTAAGVRLRASEMDWQGKPVWAVSLGNRQPSAPPAFDADFAPASQEQSAVLEESRAAQDDLKKRLARESQGRENAEKMMRESQDAMEAAKEEQARLRGMLEKTERMAGELQRKLESARSEAAQNVEARETLEKELGDARTALAEAEKALQASREAAKEAEPAGKTPKEDKSDRQRVEKALEETRASLESRVAARTTELKSAVDRLQNELTKARAADDEARHAEGQWREVFEKSPAALFLVDADTLSILAANAAAAARYGRPPETFLSLTLKDMYATDDLERLLPASDPKASAAPLKAAGAQADVIDDVLLSPLSYFGRQAYLWQTSDASPAAPSDAPAPQEEAPAAPAPAEAPTQPAVEPLRRLLSRVPGLFWTTDLDLRVSGVHGALSSAVKLRQESGPLGEVFSVKDDDSFVEIHRRALLGDPQGKNLSLDGRQLHAYVEPWRDDQGQIVGLLGYALEMPEAPPAAPAAPAPAAKAKAAPAQKPSAPAKATILVVTDQEPVRGLVRRVLREKGYALLEASHDKEALNLLEKHSGPVDLLITEILLPYSSGLALAKRLLDRFTDLRVIYLSDHTKDIKLQMGADTSLAFLQKPFTPASLDRMVADILAPKGNGEAPPKN